MPDDMKMTENGFPEGFEPREFPATWEAKEGDTLIGKIQEYRRDVKTNTDKGKSDLLQIVTREGEIVSVWLSAGLVGRITPADEGKMVYIERVADTPPSMKGRSPMKTYKVAVR